MDLNITEENASKNRADALSFIKQAIEENHYDAAEELIRSYKESWSYDEDISVLEGECFISTGQVDKAITCIEQGLSCNSANFELYFMLGEAYEMSGHPECAELCYRYSVFLCHDAEDLSFLKDNLKRYLDTFGVTLPRTTMMVRVSDNITWLKLFLQMLPLYTMPDSYEIIFIEDEPSPELHHALLTQSLGKIISYSEKSRPELYNLAIDEAEKNSDLVIIDEGGLLLEHTLFTLQLSLYTTPQTGACGSISNLPSCARYMKWLCPSADDALKYAHENNVPCKISPVRTLDLPGPVYILKRSVLKRFGWFDTEFILSYYQIKDYLFRLIDGGLNVLLCTNSLSLYISNSSSVWNSGELEKFYKKWGIKLTYSCNSRDDLISLINTDPLQLDTPVNVLEVGCACGATLIEIKRRFRNASLYGVELDEGPSSIASHFATISNENIESSSLEYPDNFFDYIIFGDVLEHLREPGQILNSVKRYLKENGSILASIPNVMHISVMKPLLNGFWTYEDAGILDRTHLKFFTYQEIIHLFQNSGYRLGPVSATTLPVSAEDQALITRLAAIQNVPESWFQAYQFLVTASKS